MYTSVVDVAGTYFNSTINCRIINFCQQLIKSSYNRCGIIIKLYLFNFFIKFAISNTRYNSNKIIFFQCNSIILYIKKYDIIFFFNASQSFLYFYGAKIHIILLLISSFLINLWVIRFMVCAISIFTHFLSP
jgi:hypothetical protein